MNWNPFWATLTIVGALATLAGLTFPRWALLIGVIGAVLILSALGVVLLRPFIHRAATQPKYVEVLRREVGKKRAAEVKVAKIPALIDEAREEGRKDAIGAYLAQQTQGPLIPTYYTMADKDSIFPGHGFGVELLPEQKVLVGARFSVSNKASVPHGVAQVIDVTNDGIAVLTVVERFALSTQYWKEADSAAQTTGIPLPGTQLIPLEFTSTAATPEAEVDGDNK